MCGREGHVSVQVFLSFFSFVYLLLVVFSVGFREEGGTMTKEKQIHCEKIK